LNKTGTVRLMTGGAELSAGMFFCVNLGKALRFGDIFGVATDAEEGDAGFFWSESGRVVSMFCEGSMTGFAVDVGVHTPA
jgi:hypothetical protein